MGTYRTFLFATFAFAAFCVAGTTPTFQGTIEPKTLSGPSLISVMRARIVRAKTTFGYLVTLNQTSSSPVSLNVTESAGILSHPTQITVPANTLSYTFYVTPFATGVTTLSVSNANGHADEFITVDGG